MPISASTLLDLISFLQFKQTSFHFSFLSLNEIKPNFEFARFGSIKIFPAALWGWNPQTNFKFIQFSELLILQISFISSNFNQFAEINFQFVWWPLFGKRQLNFFSSQFRFGARIGWKTKLQRSLQQKHNLFCRFQKTANEFQLKLELVVDFHSEILIPLVDFRISKIHCGFLF